MPYSLIPACLIKAVGESLSSYLPVLTREESAKWHLPALQSPGRAPTVLTSPRRCLKVSIWIYFTFQALFKLLLLQWVSANEASVVTHGKESACSAGDLGLIPGSGRYLDKGMATHSSILAWRIPLTEKPGRLHSMELDTTERLNTFTCF